MVDQVKIDRRIGTLVTDLLAGAARHTPHALAITDAHGRRTHAELDADANRLAHWLREGGIGAESPVLLCTERSVEMATALLAVFRAGGMAVLADPRYPARRLAGLVAASRPGAVLTTGQHGASIEAAGAEVLCLDTGRDALAGYPTDPPDVAVHPDQIAYVVHTSGSTGEPKRVAVTHRSVAHAVLTHAQAHRITAADRGAWLAAPGSSASVGELWPLLAVGASVHAAPPDVAADENTLRDWLLAQEISVAFVAMPMAERLYLAEWPERAALRLVTVGSDRVRRWARPDLPFEVAVDFGSAECNGITSCMVPYPQRLTSLTASEPDRAVPPPVGRPWPDVRVHLLDDDFREVAPGEAGEICVGGPELARGYLGDPAGTAARFAPDPFGPPGARLYRTGDLGRWRYDGRLEHRGRVDFQVKIRGFRVDPVEVERYLLEYPGVREAVVVAIDHPSGEKLLVAYLVADGDPVPAELRAYLSERLGEAAVPANFTILAAIPRTDHGKVDRRALPAPDWHGHGVAFTDRIEQDVAEVFALVLGAAEVGRTDHFLLLGGSSMSAARVAAELSRRCEVRVQLRDVMRHLTVAELATHVRTQPKRPAMRSAWS